MSHAKAESLLERKLMRPAYRARFERNYPAFVLEVRLLRALERKGWTFERLARALHTSKSNISRDLSAGGIRTASLPRRLAPWIGARRRQASLPRLAKMAEALDMEFIPLLVSQKKERTILPKIQELAAM